MVAMKVWRMSAALLLGLGLLLPLPFLEAAEDFREAYRQGRDAIDKEQWALAADRMREALRGRSDEKSGALKRNYFPHYFLGLALAGLGDCEGALGSWAESERQGEIGRSKLYENLVRSRRRCEDRIRLAGQITSLQKRLSGLESMMAALKRNPSTEQQLPGTQDKLQEARARLKQGEAQVDAGQLAAVESLLDEVLGELQAFERRPERTSDARRKPPRVETITSEEEELEDPSEEWVYDPPPVELDRAVEAFLDGDYHGVEKILEADFSAENGDVTAQAHLFRSAAFFALHHIEQGPNSDEVDSERLTRAREEARAAFAADPKLALPQRFFSPGFLELFQTLSVSDREE